MGWWMKILLAATFTFLLASGCAHRGTDSEKQITIWWAQWGPENGLQELAGRFTEETGIKVKVHQIPWVSYQDKVFLDFGNKRTDFDIVVGDS